MWAPRAQQVEVVVDEVRAPLTREDGGWWRGPQLPHGTDYGLCVDGGPPRPDPRSPWQPHGVHGPSRTFDTSRHRWQDGDWRGRDVRGTVLYELHVGTFTREGTLDAAIGRLDHLVDLGVDTVELMPVAAFPGVHGWGYDGVALYAVHDPYGGPAALQRFVDAAHGRGLAVCLDVVHNHLGPSGNYLAEFGPYFTDRHHTPWGQAVNLDGDDAHEVRAFVIDNATRWLREFHLDALRLDAVHALVDDSPTHLLAEMSTAVDALSDEVGRPLTLIAESDLNDPRTVTPVQDGGLGMGAQWADDVHHALHAMVTGERHGYYVDFGSTATTAKALTEVFVHDGTWSTFRGRTWGRPVPEHLDGHRFVVFGSNHDQVGNRALGDRPSQYLQDGQLAATAALVLLSPFTPMLFMGEEWGARTPWAYVTDHAEPELVEAIRKGRQEEFAGHGWAELYGHDVQVPDPQDPATVTSSVLDWQERDDAGGARLLTWYRDLIRLRRAVADLADGDRARVRVEHEEGRWLVLHRGGHAVVVNLTDGPLTVPVESAQVLLEWGTQPGATGLEVAAHGVAVVRREEQR
nr:malto-oligosyltrehalose trehalohydrolase [Cellulomonas bogoriensis]